MALQCGVQMAYSEHTIPIHPRAPAKAPEGAACNGCGVCCLFEPCPVGIFLTGRRSGACAAVRWDDSLGKYRCGAVVSTREVLQQALPIGARWLAAVLAPILRRIGLRWIAAGTGCDSQLEVMRNTGSTKIKVSETTVATRAGPKHHD